MTLKELKQKLEDTGMARLYRVKIIKDACDLGLREAKDIMDAAAEYTDHANATINILKARPDWSDIKSNIRKAKV